MVRVNDALYADRAASSSTTIARARGFEGRLVVLAEPDIAAGDCRIEWADGGIERDSAAIDAAIGEAVDPLSRRTPQLLPSDARASCGDPSNE